ncbi:cyclic nucleotide-binding domain-containing protein [Flavitalea sp. BT771]|uniref:Crp/Fnr family transcriptional regulator n=1 Tax=Flavitalea sp. BT771 TaxID=3063329 RepID=UPI0026E27D3C|nr:cyclic nucleotide-binding domain-containing protein [Flavitalea sp. BT771]MDO6433042.1 cyclic nucleotide-binding domain-containing protein [Flavitalea sp. BT771]MDV6221682.1 cyclic nucleotide-binding domain-containing protein [Flavitalea sp. BT771]
MEQLFILFNGIEKMSPELIAHLKKILKRKLIKKGEFMLMEGQTSNYIYFLESGLVRIYHVENAEVTSWLLPEGNIFMSVSSFFQKHPSYENIIALEDCVCWCISYRELEETLELFPEFEIHHGRILRNYYSFSELRRFRLAKQDKLERYTMLEEKEPGLLQRVSQEILCTYLQMSLNSYKRARDEYYAYKRKGK